MTLQYKGLVKRLLTQLDIVIELDDAIKLCNAFHEVPKESIFDYEAEMKVGFIFNYNEPTSQLTDEANNMTEWSVTRSQAPFCDKKGVRLWSASTPKLALEKAKKALSLCHN